MPTRRQALEERGGTLINDIRPGRDDGGTMAMRFVTTPFGERRFGSWNARGYRWSHLGIAP